MAIKLTVSDMLYLIILSIVLLSCLLRNGDAQTFTGYNVTVNRGLGAYAGAKLTNVLYTPVALCQWGSPVCFRYSPLSMRVSVTGRYHAYNFLNVLWVGINDPIVSPSASVVGVTWPQTIGLDLVSAPTASIVPQVAMTPGSCLNPAFGADSYSSYQQYSSLQMQCNNVNNPMAVAGYTYGTSGTIQSMGLGSSETVCVSFGGPQSIIFVGMFNTNLLVCPNGYMYVFPATAAVNQVMNSNPAVVWATVDPYGGRQACVYPLGGGQCAATTTPTELFYLLVNRNIYQVTYIYNTGVVSYGPNTIVGQSTAQILASTCASILAVGNFYIMVNCVSYVQLALIVNTDPTVSNPPTSGISSVTTVLSSANAACTQYAQGLGVMSFDPLANVFLIACASPGGVVAYDMVSTNVVYALDPPTCPVATSVSAFNFVVVAVCNGVSLVTAHYNTVVNFKTSGSFIPQALSLTPSGPGVKVYARSDAFNSSSVQFSN